MAPLIPAKVRISGRDWEVVEQTDEELLGVCGRAYLREGQLGIADWLTEFDRRDTVLHEALHAALYRHDFKRSPSMEESFVRAISTELIGILQDNPEFAQWLIEPIKTK